MTNFVRQKYQYFVDMNTRSDTMQVITITAGGLMPQGRLRPFFGAFKRFKLGKVSVRFVPAATLPVDPTGLSYEAGEQTVDPRDQMNPGLVRITNGEDVSSLSSILTGTSAERAYYATMLDSRWFKFPLQRGFRRTAKPLLWNVAQSSQSMKQALVGDAMRVDLNPSAPVSSSASDNLGVVQYSGTQSVYSPDTMNVTEASTTFAAYDVMDSVLMQTNRIRMGWMPTDMFDSGAYGPSPVPEVDLITVILPKAYKTSYYYRVYVEEEVLFKDPVAISPVYSTVTGTGEGIAPITTFNRGAIDRFVVSAPNVATDGNQYETGVNILNSGTGKINGGRAS